LYSSYVIFTHWDFCGCLKECKVRGLWTLLSRLFGQ